MTFLTPPDRKLPTQNRSRERVEKIIKATENLLLDPAKPEITTSSIAKAAQIPVGSVYQYFKDKDAILLAIGERVIHDMNSQLAKVFEEVSQHAHWRHVVRETVTAYINIELENKLHHALERALFANDNWRDINLKVEQNMIDFFAGYKLLEARGLSPEEARNTVRIIVIMSTTIVRRAKSLPSEAQSKQLRAEIQKMIVAYLGQVLGD